jgi:non-lysosomal glucosylceramidase
MFGLTMEKALLIAVFAAIIIGPQRLPLYASRFASLIRRVRDFADDAQDRIKSELGPDAPDLDWRKLDAKKYDPRRIIRDALEEPMSRPTRGPAKPSPDKSPATEPARDQPAIQPPYTCEAPPRAKEAPMSIADPAATGKTWLDERSPGAVAAFPLGGIGTGTVSIGARGELRDWEISNHPDKGTWLPFTFFAIRAQVTGQEAVTRVLEARHFGPHEGDSGYHIGKVAGLPRLSASRMRGEYPILNVDFSDDALPVGVRLEAFTPLVPLDVERSAIPGAVIRYHVHNPNAMSVAVTVAGSMSTPIGVKSHNVFQFPEFEGKPTIEWREADGLVGLDFGTSLPRGSFNYGTATLATADPHVTYTPRWSRNKWQDGVQLFWDDLVADGLLEPQPETLEPDGVPEWVSPLRTGSLGIVAELKPGETKEFEFYLSWHTPNRSRAWNGMVSLDNTNRNQVVLNHYATKFPDAWSAAAYLAENLPELEAATRAFHDSLYESSLPAEAIDAATSTLVALRSTTCLHLDDGTEHGIFAAWEGSFDHAGSCEGTCTHVWNYAQSVAHLFPSLERSARRTEFLRETTPEGRMRFRSNSVFGNEPFEWHAAVDGQMGSIVRLFREWRFSGDDDFLREVWPSARQALEFAFTHWDSNGDFVLDSQQHNTYDIEFYGENSLANSMFFAALRAGAELATAMGDPDAARRYRYVADQGAQRMDELLYNGEYYQQRIDDVDAIRYQYGSGCLSDQLFGQTLAHLTGLGHLFAADHVRSAIRAVHKYNFRRGFQDYASVQRTYALNDESGLVLCSWPNGGRPVLPFVYADEVWTGIEYQVATHLIYEGLVKEGLDIVRAVRDRHDGVRRNPWNEAECGNHYARSMAAWGVLLALSGVQWDARDKSLRVAPKRETVANGCISVPFSAATGWGLIEVADGAAKIRLLGGDLQLDRVEVKHPDGPTFRLDTPTRLTAGGSVLLVGP